MNNKYAVIFVCLTSFFAARGAGHEVLDAWEQDESFVSVDYKIGPMSLSAVPISITNADQVGGVITIASSGYYKITESLIYPVLITGSGVTLNLNSYRITVGSSHTSAITIAPYCNKVCVYNGYLHNSGGPAGIGCGIAVLQGCSTVLCRDIKTFQFSKGVHCAGIEGDEIVGCLFKNIDCIMGGEGVHLDYTNDTAVKGCKAIYNATIGFAMNYGKANQFFKCSAFETSGVASVAGFYSEQGEGNLFKQCVAQKTSTSSSAFTDVACGFVITGTEQKTKILECIAHDTSVVGPASAAAAYGIYFMPLLQPYDDMLSEVERFSVTNKAGTNMLGVRQVAWSPHGDYMLEVASPSNFVVVRKWNGSYQSVVCDINLSARNPRTCAWSPDGKYFVVGFLSDPEVSVYSFDGQTATSIAHSITPTYGTLSITWSPNGKFIAANDLSGAVYIFSFNGSALTLVDSTTFTNPFGSGFPIAWSADGNYICIAPRVAAPGVSLIAAPVNASGKFGTSATASLLSVGEQIACSPRGRYIAVRDQTNNLSIWQFVGGSLSLVTSSAGGAETFAGVVWSPCGRYVAVGTASGKVRVYAFTGAALVFVKDQAVATAGSGPVYALAWSPDGRYITATRTDTSNPVGQVVLTVLYGPIQCFVDASIVSNTLAVQGTAGTGFAVGTRCVVTNSLANINSVPYAYGIPNVYYGRFNVSRESSDLGCNIAEPTTL